MSHTRFRVGGLVRNLKNGWVGNVAAIECGRCSVPLSPEGFFVCRHVNFPIIYLSIETQGGHLKPWCLEKYFEPTAIGPSVWSLLRKNPLDEPPSRP